MPQDLKASLKWKGDSQAPRCLEIAIKSAKRKARMLKRVTVLKCLELLTKFTIAVAVQDSLMPLPIMLATMQWT